MSWELTEQVLEDGRGRRIAIRRQGVTVPWRDVLDGWRSDRAFQSFFSRSLAGAPLEAFRFETPPVTRATLEKPFEFVLLDAPGLDRAADVRAFVDQFDSAPAASTVITFSNLGGDAVLVVPRPAGPATAYAHLAAFVRRGPREQVQALWGAVGEAMRARIGTEPVWLSTAGMGVAWLHVRLDDRPKYYGFRPFAQAVA